MANRVMWGDAGGWERSRGAEGHVGPSAVAADERRWQSQDAFRDPGGVKADEEEAVWVSVSFQG